MRKANKILFIVACVVFVISVFVGGDYAKDCSRSSNDKGENGYSLVYSMGKQESAVKGIKGDKDEITLVVIPSKSDGITVTEIGKGAFLDCVALATVEIPNTVTVINEKAFKGCEALKKIKYNGTKQQWKKIEKGSDWNSGTGNYVVYCSDGSYAK